ncbi:adenosylcobinamide-phosphate synthase [Methanolinea mesophila]|uniref:adenosylcobinamide-phosphate synthase CbiB n=1 Tax=Methanolinea mesophila TaxID=547055 RepID=UPI0031583F79|nr:adenosylcobinamide-phosphate synthase [Methanolinea mesophila]
MDNEIILLFLPLVIPLALVVDRVLGDPHSGFHPVALLGSCIGVWGRPDRYSPGFQRAAGAIFWVITAVVFALPFFLVQFYAPALVILILGPFLLKVCFAWRSLEEHLYSVVETTSSSLQEARGKAGLLVSRDTLGLNEEQVLSAAYESVTENLVDSIVSPLFYYGLFGLTGAAVYRAANTMDAMLGYRDERARIGWWSARADDIANYIPARVTGGLLLLYFAAKGRFGPAWQAFLKDRHKRPGFNGGISMSIMAGGVGIRFEKPGVYTIGPGERSLKEAGIEIIRAERAITIIFATILTTLLLLGSFAQYIGV